MKLKSIPHVLAIATLSLVFTQSCSDAQLKQLSKTMEEVNKTMQTPAPLTNSEVISGLKEALKVGINNSSSLASKTDGYFKNPLLKIPFPTEAQNVEAKLRQLGLGNLCDQFIESLNRGAENAANKSVPVFVNAITSMSIGDGFQILKGGNNAATEYLKSKTTNDLIAAFKPSIQQSLDAVNATKYWSDIITRYNKIPLVQKVNPDLAGYATDRAIKGLFVLVADEEAKIRTNPAARVNDILKRVFGTTVK